MESTFDFTRQVHVSKLQAAERQLDVAIWLWFQDGDEVSVHTLACAAHNIVNDLHIKDGMGHKLIFGSHAIAEADRSKFVRAFKASMNFFKHADKDPSAILVFRPGITEGFILACCIGLQNLKTEPSNSALAFLTWEIIHRPTLFEELPDLIRRDIADTTFSEIQGLNKIQFYNRFVQEVIAYRKLKESSSIERHE